MVNYAAEITLAGVNLQLSQLNQTNEIIGGSC